MIEVRRLRVLHEVAAAGSVSAAARALGYTPSAVSQQLAVLERETGAALIQRNGRSIALSPAAHTLLEHAQVVFAELERAEADLARAGARVEGNLRLAAPATALRTLVPEALTRLARTAPQLDVQVSEAEPGPALAALADRRLEAVVAHEYDLLARWRTDGLQRRELLVDPLRVVGAEATGAVRLADLSEAPWLLPPADSSCGQLVRRACEAAGFEPREAATSTDFAALAAMARAGHGVALVPALALAGTAADDARPTAPGLARRLFAAVRDGSETQPGIAAVLAALEAAA